MRRFVQALCALWLGCALIAGARATGVTNMLLGASGVSTLNTTLTAGQYSNTGPPPVVVIGYCNNSVGSGCTGGTTYGSLSVSTIGSLTIAYIITTAVAGTNSVNISICGFSAEPPIGWLLNMTFNGVSLTGASATQSYSGGCSTWGWSGQTFTMSSGTAYPGTIEHQ